MWHFYKMSQRHAYPKQPSSPLPLLQIRLFLTPLRIGRRLCGIVLVLPWTHDW